MRMKPSTMSNQDQAYGVLMFIAAVAALHFAQDVLVPIALALLLAFLLAPMVERLQRLHTGRVLGVMLTTIVAFTIIAALSYGVARQFLGLVESLPTYRGNLIDKVRRIPMASGGELERGVDTVKELNDELRKTSPGKPGAPEIAKVQVVEPPPNIAQVLRSFFGPLVGPVSTASIVIVFTIFMLLQREDLRDRLVRLMGASRMHTTVAALDDAAQRVSRYLLMQALINATQGTLVGIGLYAIGVPNALLWGALTVVLRFIPYLGPALAAAGPVLLSVAVFPGWAEPLMVIGLIAVLELVTNNVLEPRLYGSTVGVSSFALLVAAVFWTWLWGVAGLFLATPLTVCLVVMGKYIPHLEFLGVMLGDQPVLEMRERFYQRLLANDSEEAQELIDEALQHGSLVDLCDHVVLPALRFVEQDHERGAIDGARRTTIVDLIAELIDVLPQPELPADALASVAVGGTRSTLAPEATSRRMSVLLLPASDRADEVAAQLIARVLVPLGFDVHVPSAATLKGEMLESVERIHPDAICLSAAPPSAVIHARYLGKKLAVSAPDIPIVVGLWDAQGDLQKATARLVAVGIRCVATNAADMVNALTQLRQPLLQGVLAREPASTDRPSTVE
jgi:predicted PurR-regulated permease PerM/methylmalonyl-CoA mutase cobalamin-binding subunit